MKTLNINLTIASLTLLAGTTVALAQPSGDFDNDGFADFVVGAPLEDVGSAADSGSVWIFSGGNGAIAMTRTASWTLATLGATSVGAEHFGDSICVGDFNADAYADVAIAVGRSVRVGSATHRAGVAIVFGSATGLNPASVTWRFFDEEGAGFVTSLAAGDFNGDGKDDLAVGSSNTTIFERRFNPVTFRFDFIPYDHAGRIWTYTSNGTKPLAILASHDYGTLGVPYDQAEWSLLGSCLAAGDFNGDGKFDLAAGAPNHDGAIPDEGGFSPGAAHVIYGTSSGLAAAGRQILRPGTELTSVGGNAGSSMVAGRFNNDASWDLAMGTYDAGPAGGGSVRVIMGAPTKFKTDKSETIFSQDTPGMLDVSQSGDMFGAVLAVGRLNSDGFDDLVVGVMGEDIGSIESAGAVQVIYSRTDGLGLSAANNQFLHQDFSVIGDSCEVGDFFGETVVATRKPIDRTGSGGNLIIGVPNETLTVDDDGMIHVLRGGTTGVVMTGQVIISQDSTSVPGSNEEGDHFGRSLGAR